MFSAPPTIGFDTSALNWLKDDVARRLYGRFHVLLFGMNAEEIVATPSVKAERREVLLTRLEGLLCSGHCLWPPHMILESLISAHFKYPMQFSWQRVSARSMMYEQGIIRRVFTEEDSSQQLEHQNAVQEKFEQIWAGIRPELDAIRSNRDKVGAQVVSGRPPGHPRRRWRNPLGSRTHYLQSGHQG